MSYGGNLLTSPNLLKGRQSCSRGLARVTEEAQSERKSMVAESVCRDIGKSNQQLAMIIMHTGLHEFLHIHIFIQSDLSSFIF